MDARKVRLLHEVIGIKFKQCPVHKGLCGSKSVKFTGLSSTGGENFSKYDYNRYQFNYKCSNGHKLILHMNLEVE